MIKLYFYINLEALSLSLKTQILAVVLSGALEKGIIAKSFPSLPADEEKILNLHILYVLFLRACNFFYVSLHFSRAISTFFFSNKNVTQHYDKKNLKLLSNRCKKKKKIKPQKPKFISCPNLGQFCYNKILNFVCFWFGFLRSVQIFV